MTGSDPRTAPGSPRLQALAALHRPRVWRVAVRFLRDPDQADDVTQEAFLRLQRSPPSCPDAQVGTWLHAVVVNLCRDRLRARLRRGTPVELDAAEGVAALTQRPDPEGRLDRERARRDLDAALARLPPEMERAVRLRYLDGLTYAEIAEATGAPVGTIASRVFRALRRLGEDLDPRHLEVLS